MAALPIDPRALGTHMLVTGCRPAKEYKDGVPTGKAIAYRYRTLLVDTGHMDLNVLVTDGNALDLSNGQAIPVRFDNLTVRPYVDKNKALAYSAAADAIHALNGKGQALGP